MEALKYEDRQPVTSRYDKEADVLYISFGAPEPGLAVDAGGGVLIRYREEDGVILGATIAGIAAKLGTSADASRKTRTRPRRTGRVPSK